MCAAFGNDLNTRDIVSFEPGGQILVIVNGEVKCRQMTLLANGSLSSRAIEEADTGVDQIIDKPTPKLTPAQKWQASGIDQAGSL